MKFTFLLKGKNHSSTVRKAFYSYPETTFFSLRNINHPLAWYECRNLVHETEYIFVHMSLYNKILDCDEWFFLHVFHTHMKD